MDWLYYVLLLALLVVGIGITVMSLPGLWLMAAAAALYALITHGDYLGIGGLVVIVLLCLVGEVVETLGKARGAGKAGGSKRAMLLAAVGGILGGIFLTIPFPIVGTIAGVCIGAFGGAMLGQLTVHQDIEHSARVGWGAAKGTLVGILAKLAVGGVIFIVVAWRALPIGGTPTRTIPTSLPSLPATTQAVEGA